MSAELQLVFRSGAWEPAGIWRRAFIIPELARVRQCHVSFRLQSGSRLRNRSRPAEARRRLRYNSPFVPRAVTRMCCTINGLHPHTRFRLRLIDGETLRNLRKGPGRRPQHQPRAQRDPAPVRAEPAARPRDGQRRHPPAARLHALPPVEQGRQGRPEGRQGRAVRQAVVHRSAPAGDRPVLAGHPGRQPAVRLGPDSARSGDRRSSSTATSRAQTRRVFQNLGAILEGRRRLLRSRRPDHGLSWRT